MQIFKNIDELPKFEKAVITIGTFDGVHLGHQKIIEQLNKEAAVIGGCSVLISFFPHPKKIVADGAKPLLLLNTQDEKYLLLEKLGVDYLVIIQFDKKFSEQEPIDYIKNFLVGKFNPHAIIIGYDHRFGKGRSGDFLLLEKYASINNYVVNEIPEKILKHVTISSTKIREALLNGDIAIANEYLGYKYFLSGIVVEGNKLGHTIGFATANIDVAEEKLIPGNGVYAVDVCIGNNDKLYKAMMNIGLRPTIGGTIRVIETNIFEFDEIIYGEKLTVTFKAFLRREIKFDSMEMLKQQLALDKQLALKY